MIDLYKEFLTQDTPPMLPFIPPPFLNHHLYWYTAINVFCYLIWFIFLTVGLIGDLLSIISSSNYSTHVRIQFTPPVTSQVRHIYYLIISLSYWTGFGACFTHNECMPLLNKRIRCVVFSICLHIGPGHGTKFGFFFDMLAHQFYP